MLVDHQHLFERELLKRSHTREGISQENSMPKPAPQNMSAFVKRLLMKSDL